MALNYGFFDAVDGDRTYSADDMGKLFDGVLSDGVFNSIGNKFRVASAGSSNPSTVTIDTGKAWFNHVWFENDALMNFVLPEAHATLNRIDGLYIVIDKTQAVRACRIDVVSGTPASPAAKPVTPTPTEDMWYYPIAYIARTAGASGSVIYPGSIEYVVGSSECPLAMAIVSDIDISPYVEKFSADFNNWMLQTNIQWQLKSSGFDSDFNTSQTTRATEFDTAQTQRQNSYEENESQRNSTFSGFMYSSTTAFGDLMDTSTTTFNDFMTSSETDYAQNRTNWYNTFNSWFQNLQDQLDDNQAGNLQNQINNILTDELPFPSEALPVGSGDNSIAYSRIFFAQNDSSGEPSDPLMQGRFYNHFGRVCMSGGVVIMDKAWLQINISNPTFNRLYYFGNVFAANRQSAVGAMGPNDGANTLLIPIGIMGVQNNDTGGDNYSMPVIANGSLYIYQSTAPATYGYWFMIPIISQADRQALSNWPYKLRIVFPPMLTPFKYNGAN
jgi:hypothetical protein